MRSSSLYFLLTIGIAAQSASSMDFTPKPGFKELETVKIPVVFFEDGQKTVQFIPPPNWRLNGSGPKLTMSAPDLVQANSQLVVVNRDPKWGNVTDQTSDVLAKWVRTFLPEHAEEIEPVAVYPSPFAINALPSKEFIFSYSLNGQRISQSIGVVDLNAKQRFVANTICRAKDFKDVREAVIRSLFSWEER